jgi:hypothetical protein
MVTDDEHELIKHVSVYQLSESWGLRQSLRDIPYASFQDLLNHNWGYRTLYHVWKRVLRPYLHGYPLNNPVDGIQEDRIIKLMLQTLSKQQSLFQEIFLRLSFESLSDAEE